MPSIKLILLSMTKKMWPKVSAYALLGVGSALAAAAIKGSIADENLRNIVDSETVGNLLTILASSMLAVTTFSLSTMVSAYSAATSNVTPRATKLITEDKTTRDALSTFLGTFLFSLVGIIALDMGVYEGGGRFVLFVTTLGIIVLIVVTFIRWIERLTSLGLGRVGETSQLVEAAAAKALIARARKPTLGCNRLEHLPETLSVGAELKARISGYLQYLDVEKVSKIAEENDTDIYVAVTPGKYVTQGTVLAVMPTGVTQSGLDSLDKCFTIADQRTFEQDPRFGLCVLAEVASRATSPATNDNGTAIDIVTRLCRVLESYALERDEDNTVEFTRVWIPALCTDDLFQDAFNPLARDGAGIFEVQARLQKALVHLGSLSPEYREIARKYSAIALAYAEGNLFLKEEKDALRQMAVPLATGGDDDDLGQTVFPSAAAG